jgi:PAS domain S-box-containing protein
MTAKGEILIVDDTHASLKLLTDILTKEGYQVRLADSGERALSSISAKLPDLILLDIRMPGMDGFEVFRRLKAQEDSRDIPVIFLTPSTDMDKRAEGLKLGAADFVSEPFQSEELLARVQTHVELRRLRIRLGLQATELRRSEQQYRSLFDNMLDGFAYCKMLYDENNQPVDFIYLDVNRSFEQLTGLKNVIGKPVSEVIPGIKELSPELFESYGRVASTGKPERFKFDLKSLNQWLLISVYSPEKGYFVAVFDNITEHKRAEMALRESEEKFRILLENTPLPIAYSNKDGVITFRNICAHCKKIRDDKGYWNQVEEYIVGHTDAQFSHGICPECGNKLYGDLYSQ